MTFYSDGDEDEKRRFWKLHWRAPGQTVSFHKRYLPSRKRTGSCERPQDKALVGNPLTLLRILPQMKPEHLFFGLGRCYEERNSAVPLVGEVILFPLNVQRQCRRDLLADYSV